MSYRCHIKKCSIKVFCDFNVEENGGDDQVLQAEESLSEQLRDHSNRIVFFPSSYFFSEAKKVKEMV